MSVKYDYEELLSKITRKTGDQGKSDKESNKVFNKNLFEDLYVKDKTRDKRHVNSNTKSNAKSNNDVEDDEKFSATVDRDNIDYYKILGIAEDSNVKTIKRAYHKRLRKYHPDNLKDKSDKEAVRKNKEKYKLINEAYRILNDEYRRKAYDTGKKFESLRSKNLVSQKNSFKEFLKLQEQNMTEEDRKLAKLNHVMTTKECNSKHGYDEEKEDVIDKQEFNRRMEDMFLQREQEEMTIQHENHFEGRQFNQTEFNRMFEKKKKRDTKRQKRDVNGIVPVCEDGVMAFNDGIDSSFASVDAYDRLYDTGSYGGASDKFAGIGSGMIGADNSDSDEISIDSNDIEDTYDTHNKGVSKASIDDMLQKAMAEREMQNGQFEKMDLNEYGSAIDDKYGISKDFGFMVGNDKFGHQVGRKGNTRNTGNGDEKEKAKYEAYKELTDK